MTTCGQLHTNEELFMNKSYCIRGVICIALLATSALSANATLITFDPLPVSNNANIHLTPTPYDESDYRFFSPGRIIYVGNLHPAWVNANNSTAIGQNTYGEAVTLSRVDGSDFAIKVVELSPFEIGNQSFVSIVAHLSAGGTVGRNIIIPDAPGAKIVTWNPPLSGLSKVEFWNVSPTGRFQIDNVEVTLTTVPVGQSTWGHIKALYND